MRELEVAILLILCGFCIGFGVDVFFTFRKEIDKISERVDVCVQKEKENTEYLEKKARQYEALFDAYTKGVNGEW